jgi:hypothetical protein
MRHRFGTTPEPHALAEVIPAPAADATLAAGDADLEGDTVTDAEARHLGPDGDYGPGRLVAEGERHAGAEVAIGKLLVVADIRPADACCVDGNLKLATAGFLNAPAFLRRRLAEVTETENPLASEARRRVKEQDGISCVTRSDISREAGGQG